MNVFIEFSELVFSLFIICFSLIGILLINFKKNKTREINKLNYLFLELELEKSISNKNLKIPEELNKIEKNTHQNFLKVNVTIINIDFSLSEIFNFKL